MSGGFRDPVLKAFQVLWIKKVCLFMLVSRFLFLAIFGSEIGCLGLEKQAADKGGIAKIKFRRNWISHDFWVHFLLFCVALEKIFMTFVAQETGLRFGDFSL